MYKSFLSWEIRVKMALYIREEESKFLPLRIRGTALRISESIFEKYTHFNVGRVTTGDQGCSRLCSSEEASYVYNICRLSEISVKRKVYNNRLQLGHHHEYHRGGSENKRLFERQLEQATRSGEMELKRDAAHAHPPPTCPARGT